MYPAVRSQFNNFKVVADKAKWLAQQCPYIEFISGKWFANKKEIKKINRYFKEIFDKNKIQYRSSKEIDEIITSYIEWNGKDGKWYEASIITEAKENLKDLEEHGIPLPALPYPLNHFKLKILHSLIDGGQPYFFILTGEGGCGKSTFGNIVKQCFDGDVSSVMMDKLGSESYLSAALEKRLCYSAEISDGDIPEATLKKLVTKDTIQCRKLYGNAYEVEPQTVFMWCCNENIPKIDVTDSGMVRRTIFYHMKKEFDVPLPGLDKKEWSREEIIIFIMHALKEDISDISECFRSMTIENLLKNNAVYKYQTDDWEEFKRIYFQIEGNDRYRPQFSKWLKIKEFIKKNNLWDPDKSFSDRVKETKEAPRHV